MKCSPICLHFDGGVIHHALPPLHALLQLAFLLFVSWIYPNLRQCNRQNSMGFRTLTTHGSSGHAPALRTNAPAPAAFRRFCVIGTLRILMRSPPFHSASEIAHTRMPDPQFGSIFIPKWHRKPPDHAMSRGGNGATSTFQYHLTTAQRGVGLDSRTLQAAGERRSFAPFESVTP
jgi:hypothetical protein